MENLSAERVTELQETIRQYRDKYEEMLKDNTRLHAEKKHIAESAALRIDQADKEIAKLHDVINGITSNAQSIVRHYFSGHINLNEVVQRIDSLKPPKIGG